MFKSQTFNLWRQTSRRLGMVDLQNSTRQCHSTSFFVKQKRIRNNTSWIPCTHMKWHLYSKGLKRRKGTFVRPFLVKNLSCLAFDDDEPISSAGFKTIRRYRKASKLQPSKLWHRVLGSTGTLLMVRFCSFF